MAAGGPLAVRRRQWRPIDSALFAVPASSGTREATSLSVEVWRWVTKEKEKNCHLNSDELHRAAGGWMNVDSPSVAVFGSRPATESAAG